MDHDVFGKNEWEDTAMFQKFRFIDVPSIIVGGMLIGTITVMALM